MKRLLILFADGFPYGISEPFLETEYLHYGDYFDHVLIVTASKRTDKPTRILMDSGVEVITDYTLSKDIKSIFEAIPWLLRDRVFFWELKRLIYAEHFSLKKLQRLLACALCGNHRARMVHGWLREHPQYAAPVLYSYWMQIPAYAAERLNRKLGDGCYSITRAHGWDLYLERGVEGYHPFHEHLYRSLDEIAVISEQGKRYLAEHYGASETVSVHRLGALDHGVCNPSVDREVLRIVTCSRTIPLKRLNRLVDALSAITYPVHWTHIGGGEAQAELEKHAHEKLPRNIDVKFYGTVPNTMVYEVFKTQPFHVFVNVSSTEGVPVSIMEAMNFSIPVIATDVGGTAEMIEPGKNGILLPADFTDDMLIRAIDSVKAMTDAEYSLLRVNARIKFQESYDAVKNYKAFLEHLRGK